MEARRGGNEIYGECTAQDMVKYYEEAGAPTHPLGQLMPSLTELGLLYYYVLRYSDILIF